jgi:hypothetical protein
VRVLDGDERRGGEVLLVGMEILANLVGVEDAVRTDRLDLDAGKRRGGARFVLQDVTVPGSEHHVARPCQRVDRRLVRHRARGKEEGRLLSQQLGSALLEPVHRRVFAVDVIADLGRHHRFPHGRGRSGDRVAAQIDGLHGSQDSSSSETLDAAARQPPSR